MRVANLAGRGQTSLIQPILSTPLI